MATVRHGLDQVQGELARRQAAREALGAAERESEQASAAEVELAEAATAAERLAADLAGKVERLQVTLDAAENQQRALQRLAQAIRQRDDGRAALRAVASEVRLELEPQAWGRVRVDGRALDATSRWLRIVEPLGHRDCGRGSHPGPPRDRGPQTPAGQRQGRRATDRPRARGARAAPAGYQSPAAGVRACRRRAARGHRDRAAARGGGSAVLARGWRRGHGADRGGAADRRPGGAAGPGPPRARSGHGRPP